MGLKAGTFVTLEELISGTAVVSGNDAAIAIAEHIGGSVDNFVQLMNIKAKRLGMWSSHFVNPNGLPAIGQVTTARDIAKLSVAYIKRFPHCLEIHSQQKYTYNNRTRSNPNRLLGFCPGVDGLKTGFVNASGYNLSATGIRAGRRLVAVVLGASSPGIRKTETARLLEYGFEGTPLTSVVVVKDTKQQPAAKRKVLAKRSKRTKTAKSCPVKGGKQTNIVAVKAKKVIPHKNQKIKNTNVADKKLKTAGTATSKTTKKVISADKKVTQKKTQRNVNSRASAQCRISKTTSIAN